MAALTILPAGVTIVVESGETVLAAARRSGLRWPTVCGVDAECGTCWALVEEGAEQCSPMAEDERMRLSLGLKARESRARLACQLRLDGPVTVSRRSVRPG